MAVIVRNGAQVSELQRYLSGQGIPVRVPVAESAVRDEIAVRPLLDAFAVALDPGLLTPETAVSNRCDARSCWAEADAPATPCWSKPSWSRERWPHSAWRAGPRAARQG
jgi:hypothetical protein